MRRFGSPDSLPYQRTFFTPLSPRFSAAPQPQSQPVLSPKVGTNRSLRHLGSICRAVKACDLLVMLLADQSFEYELLANH